MVLQKLADVTVSQNRSQQWGTVAQNCETVEEDGRRTVIELKHIEQIQCEHS